MLENPAVKLLGDRWFVVGEPRERPESPTVDLWKKSISWIPLADVQAIYEFRTFDEMLEVDTAHKRR